MKVVINKCYGGFKLSDKAIDRLKELAKEKGDKNKCAQNSRSKFN